MGGEAMVKKQEIITMGTREYILPEGVRLFDLQHLDCIDEEILIDLHAHGRRARWYYYARDQMDNVKKLKSRRLIAVIKADGKYSYDLTEAGLFALQHGFV